MRTGKVDLLAFIGGSRTADSVIKEHPHPHRLRLFLQLEGKNLGIVTKSADIELTLNEVVLGSLSFNGQRCTAIKLVMVHKSIADTFVQQLGEKISAMKCGLPWEEGVKITPLPEAKKPSSMEELIVDAVGKGAKVINANGGEIHGSLFRPAVVYPVTSSMRLWHEEQFGPVVPVAVYQHVDEIKE